VSSSVASISVETARRDAAKANFAEDAANGALDDEALDSTRVSVATSDGGFNGVGDSVDHGVHGRSRSRHLLPWMNNDSGELPASAPVNSFPLCVLAVVGRARA
jgi:hypothetical protein